MSKELTPGERLALMKKEENKNYKDIQRKVMEYTYMVYDNAGNILYKGLQEPDMTNYDDCKSYKFKTSDIKIVDEQGKSVGQFMIEEDEHGVCFIKIKETKQPKINVKTDFLTEITDTSIDCDVYITYTDTDWIVTLLSDVTVKQTLNFYVTPPKDPHILLDKISLTPKMFTNSDTAKIKKELPENHTSFSIYTHKIFEKYSRL
jgi:hypothetical protein